MFHALIGGQSPVSATAANQVTSPGSGSAVGTGPAGSGAVGNASALQQYAFSLFPSYGWGADQQQPLVKLWNQESGWNARARNPSGAYGIPQSLPGAKMASAGADWETNPKTQIKWGLGYIASVYVTPQGAWNHEVANGWY